MKLTLASVNARGMQQPGRYASFVNQANQWRKRVSVWAIQEHNLDPAREDELRRIAASKDFHVIIGFAPMGADGTHWGGTMIMVDARVVTVKRVIERSEDLSRACIEWNGCEWDVAFWRG